VVEATGRRAGATGVQPGNPGAEPGQGLPEQPRHMHRDRPTLAAI
jgi:hypothetical protein